MKMTCGFKCAPFVPDLERKSDQLSTEKSTSFKPPNKFPSLESDFSNIRTMIGEKWIGISHALV